MMKIVTILLQWRRLGVTILPVMLWLCVSCGQTIPSRPNILFIMTDDQARWSVGVYDNRECLTPNMDRLAREGMLFTQAYTKPVCSPSRAMLLTGRYSHRSGIHDFIEANILNGLPPETVTLAEMLKDAGYATGLIGKWHLGHKDEHFPTNHGFDEFMGFNDGGIKPLNPTLYKDGQYRKFEGHCSNILTDEALEFISRHRDKPFALFYFTRAPHLPYTPVPDEDLAHYRDRTLTVPKAGGVPEERMQAVYRAYYASVTQIDRNLGRLLGALQRLELEDNTLVVFTSDNGYNIGQHNGLEGKGNGMLIASPLRRPNMWDTSIMVPLMIRWPSVIQPGSVCDSLVSLADFFPTFLEITGMRTEGLELDGHSLLPLMQGRPPAQWRDALYDAYDMHAYTRYRNSEDSMRMIRTKDWKLVLHLKQGEKHELYNLRSDPDELQNLYGDPGIRNIQRQLDARLREWMRQNDAETIGQFTEWRGETKP